VKVSLTPRIKRSRGGLGGPEPRGKSFGGRGRNVRVLAPGIGGFSKRGTAADLFTEVIRKLQWEEVTIGGGKNVIFQEREKNMVQTSREGERKRCYALLHGKGGKYAKKEVPPTGPSWGITRID